MKILSGLIAGLTLITFMIIPQDASSSSCDFQEVLTDCNETATQNYENGHIDTATYYEFQTVHCPAAATSCLEEA